MADLGMHERPYIELPARGFPLWQKGDWSRLTTMTVSYGHGLAVTPLHLASAYAAMVNGGIWRPATLYKIEPGHAPKGRRVFKAIDQRADEPVAADDRGLWHRPERRCARLSRRRQDRLGGKAGRQAAIAARRWSRPSLPPSRWTIRATCHRHARRAQGHGRQLLPADRRLERRADRRPAGPPYRPGAGRDARRYARHRSLRPEARWWSGSAE